MASGRSRSSTTSTCRSAPAAGLRLRDQDRSTEAHAAYADALLAELEQGRSQLRSGVRLHLPRRRHAHVRGLAFDSVLAALPDAGGLTVRRTRVGQRQLADLAGGRLGLARSASIPPSIVRVLSAYRGRRPPRGAHDLGDYRFDDFADLIYGVPRPAPADLSGLAEHPVAAEPSTSPASARGGAGDAVGARAPATASPAAEAMKGYASASSRR